MNHQQVLKYIKASAVTPVGTPQFNKWLQQADFFEFLQDSLIDEIPVYVSTHTGLYIYSAILPSDKLKGNFVADLMTWNASPGSTWGYGYHFKNGKPVLSPISPPLDGKILHHAQPLTFLRHFNGRIGSQGYVEILQQFSHINGLHFLEERSAYCRIDSEGDIEDVIKIHKTDNETLVTVKRDVLDFYLFISESVLLRLFDVRRSRDDDYLVDGTRTEESVHDANNEIFSRTGFIKNDGKAFLGLSRGFHIVRNRQAKKKMMQILMGGKDKTKKYATYIAYDWKNKKVKECSCDPAHLASYFVESMKPYEITPAFFKPEVLLRYKQHPEKYALKERSISCRDSWHLETYDINEAGQVHTYLIYLSRLPYSEQEHWKLFNEPPKSNISKRAYKTDFQGSWDVEESPLSKLKRLLEEFPKVQHESKPDFLWNKPQDTLIEQLHYVVTDSRKEWEDEVMKLAKVLIEGIDRKYLKKLALSLSCYDEKLRSIKLLKACLDKVGIDAVVIEEVILPLGELQRIRSETVVHRNGQGKTKELKELLSKYGSYKAHYRDLLGRCVDAVNTLIALINKNYLDIK